MELFSSTTNSLSGLTLPDSTSAGVKFVWTVHAFVLRLSAAAGMMTLLMHRLSLNALLPTDLSASGSWETPFSVLFIFSRALQPSNADSPTAESVAGSLTSLSAVALDANDDGSF